MKKILFLFFFLTLGLGWIATPDFPIQTTLAAPPAKDPIPRPVVVKVLNLASIDSGIPYQTLIDAYDNGGCSVSYEFINPQGNCFLVKYTSGGGLLILVIESNL
ncbi:MAG: hypothetical protein H6581_31570 [Bacteroidia bacterium]|nr:hypothetical protein [Bacteroidia bacterium]